jgi:hypothetical protein
MPTAMPGLGVPGNSQPRGIVAATLKPKTTETQRRGGAKKDKKREPPEDERMTLCVIAPWRPCVGVFETGDRLTRTLAPLLPPFHPSSSSCSSL